MALQIDGKDILKFKAEKLWLHEDVTIEQDKGPDLQLCRICFTTDGNLYSMKMDKGLDQAYGTLTGLSVQNEENMPPYLCTECSSQLMNCINFRNKSLRAHLLLLEILRKHDCITLEVIKNLNGCQDENCNLDATQNSNSIDQYNLETLINIKRETECTDEQCLRNELNSQDFDSVNVKKENEYLFNQDNGKDEDTMCTSTSNLQDRTFVHDIKVEKFDAYDEITNVDNADSKKYSASIKGDDESVVFSEVNPKGITNMRTTKGIHQRSAHKLLLFDKLCCNMCPYKTAWKWNLLRHLKTHDSIKSLNCNTTHIDQKVNFTNKRYTCDLCKKTYSGKCGLQKHMKSHFGEKPYACDVCTKSFQDRRDLQNHLRIHSGEKPFGCDLCKKTFSERGNLLRHIRIHSGEKPHVCKFCKTSFNQKHHLKRHLTKHNKLLI